jgi:hypothetical protein
LKVRKEGGKAGKQEGQKEGRKEGRKKRNDDIINEILALY